MKKYNAIQIIRALGYLYLIVFAIGSSYNGKGNFTWQTLIIAAILILFLFLRRRIPDIIIGIICSLLSLYMILAITNDFVHHLQRSKPVSNPLTYFGVGYSLFVVALFLSVMILFSTSSLRYSSRQTR